MKKEINIESLSNYWKIEAEEALNVAWHLFEKNDFSYSLFFGHLAIEKILKSIFVVKNNEHAPHIHNLVRLAELSQLNLKDIDIELLTKISRYNLESRYPDQKRTFRKMCNKEFTQKELKEIEKIFQWLKSIIK